MICLLGDSCAGKTSLERKLTERGMCRIVSYTTRQKRANEENNVDYHFISDDEFFKKLDNGFFIEKTKYNGWSYGIAKEDCIDDRIAVVEPVGFRQLKSNKDLNIISFYIKVPERERVIRMMERGDNVMESFRRIISDQGSFNGIEREVDYVIENPRDCLDDAVKNIETLIAKEKQRRCEFYKSF